MKKIIAISAAILLVVAISCNKDQRVVKDLEGTWKVTAESENGVAQPASSFENETYTFQKCKVKKGACNGTANFGLGGDLPFTYLISEKGKKITITIEGFGSSTGDILEHSDTKFRFKTTDSAGDVTETTLEKK